MRKKKYGFLIMIFLILAAVGKGIIPGTGIYEHTQSEAVSADFVSSEDNTTYAILNNNTPQFEESLLVPESFEEYYDLDSLGRCTGAIACIGTDLMPTEERGAIGAVKPTGWHTVKYDCVDGKYLYNRCHLIGYQLTGENANEKNLITGTRFMNVDGMLPFENMVADYIKETGNHVLYRVTPVFMEDNLLAEGVRMEAKSIEDAGDGIRFHVFVYNIQPGVEIDYQTGDSRLKMDSNPGLSADTIHYVLNTKSQKFHLPDCSSVSDMDKKI